MEKKIKKEIAYFMRRLYRQGLTTTSGGNISYRLNEKEVLITPSASDKGRTTWREIGCLSVDSNNDLVSFRPSIESRMHLAIYRSRPDVKAIVHAHPVTCSIFAASTAVINTRLLSESYAILGEVAYSDYFCMGTDKLAETVARKAEDADCVIMRNHGALTVGVSLLQAFDRLEVLESAAKVTLACRHLLQAESCEISAEELAAIDALMKR